MRVNQAEIVLTCGDITHVQVDAIVNAANSGLLGGGGVDGAIHRAAGPALLEMCRKIRDEQGPCPAGEAVITRAGDLAAQFVIHTVGPVWQGGGQGEPELLARCHERCLELALESGCTSIAFPAISTGAYGYPVAEAATVAIETVRSWLAEREVSMTVRFVLYSAASYRVFYQHLSRSAERQSTDAER